MSSQPRIRSGHVGVDGARLFYREVGQGPTLVVLHGGPDFDHVYLLPELDRLAECYRMVYYDQRGRGRSNRGVRPEDVTIESESDDLEELRSNLDVERFALLGHSWGGILAMEYTARHPERVASLILMNTNPGSHQGRLNLVEHLAQVRTPEESRRMDELRSSSAFQRGDLETEAEYYRIHFRPALARARDVPRVVARLRTHFTEESVLLARQIERRLYEQTWLQPEYDVLMRLADHPIPTLLIHGDRDFIPVEMAADIAEVLPNAELVVLQGCGHFPYLEQPDDLVRVIDAFARRR